MIRKKLQHLGEFELIERIKQLLPTTTKKNLIVGIGDDCAVLEKSGDDVYVVSIDMQVEGTHFLKETFNSKQIGQKTASVNLSDVAAMGATPAFAFLSFGFPKSTDLNWVDELMNGVIEQLSSFDTMVAGGNLSQTEKVVLDIAIIGIGKKSQLLLRSGAQVGDEIYVSNYTGLSSLGFELSKFNQPIPQEFLSFISNHTNPTPRIQLGQALSQSGLVTACIDCSDGLIADLIHLCTASQVGCVLVEDFLPLSPHFLDAVEFLHQHSIKKQTAREFQLNGGEDYELIFTAKPTFYTIKQSIERESDVRLHRIGKITADSDDFTLHNSYGGDEPLQSKGWDHFLA